MERYYIRDCQDNIVGNPKGYATFKGAERQAEMRGKNGSAASRAIWKAFYQVEDELIAQGENTNGRPIYSIKLQKPFILVHRVEGKNKRGMYQGLWYDIGLPTSDAHPCVYEDSLYRDNAAKFDEDLVRRDPDGKVKWAHEPYGHRFGFEDMAQLRRWIYDDQWVSKLSDNGANLVIYQVPTECVIVGRTQVTFDHTQATELSRYPLANILL